MIIGRINVISTSKIKKIIAMRKNRRENGNREDDLGSNPHSNGEHFSRSINDFLDKMVEIFIIIIEIVRIKEDIIIIIIIYTNNRPYDWKSNILFILYK